MGFRWLICTPFYTGGRASILALQARILKLTCTAETISVTSPPLSCNCYWESANIHEKYPDSMGKGEIPNQKICLLPGRKKKKNEEEAGEFLESCNG